MPLRLRRSFKALDISFSLPASLLSAVEKLGVGFANQPVSCGKSVWWGLILRNQRVRHRARTERDGRTQGKSHKSKRTHLAGAGMRRVKWGKVPVMSVESLRTNIQRYPWRHVQRLQQNESWVGESIALRLRTAGVVGRGGSGRGRSVQKKNRCSTRYCTVCSKAVQISQLAGASVPASPYFSRYKFLSVNCMVI